MEWRRAIELHPAVLGASAVATNSRRRHTLCAGVQDHAGDAERLGRERSDRERVYDVRRHSALAADIGAERHITTGATLRTGLLPKVERDRGPGLGRPIHPRSAEPRNIDDTSYPALSPGRALLLAFPPAGRLPSTISAADLWSALFEASQVLCSRPTHRLFHDGFASSASRRGPTPPWRFGRDEVSQVPARSLHTGSRTTAEWSHLA